MTDAGRTMSGTPPTPSSRSSPTADRSGHRVRILHPQTALVRLPPLTVISAAGSLGTYRMPLATLSSAVSGARIGHRASTQTREERRFDDARGCRRRSGSGERSRTPNGGSGRRSPGGPTDGAERPNESSARSSTRHGSGPAQLEPASPIASRAIRRSYPTDRPRSRIASSPTLGFPRPCCYRDEGLRSSSRYDGWSTPSLSLSPSTTTLTASSGPVMDGCSGELSPREWCLNR